MKKVNIVKENRDFRRIMDISKLIKNNFYTVFIEKNDNITNYHFGISVSKKLGNFNCIIILKRDILNKNYQEMEEKLFEIFNKINIIKGE